MRRCASQAARRQDARELLEEGIENDADTKLSPLAWLALFDLLQREGDKAAFDALVAQVRRPVRAVGSGLGGEGERAAGSSRGAAAMSR